MSRFKNLPLLVISTICMGLAGTAISASESSTEAEFDCLIEPNLTVSVGSPTRGIVDAVLVDRSQLVEKGQTLAVLNSAVEQAAVKEAEHRAAMNSAIDARQAELELARLNMQRIRELSEKNMAAHQEMDEARAQLLVARTNVQEAHDRKRLSEFDLQRAAEVLKQRTIVSPISGVVRQVLTFPGEYVEENPILEVAQIDPLRVEVILPVQMFGKVGNGFTAQVMPEEPLSGSFEATVTAVDRVIDAASGTFGVRLALPNPHHRLPGGLKCSISFSSAAPPNAQTQPAAAGHEPGSRQVAVMTEESQPSASAELRATSPTEEYEVSAELPACVSIGPFRTQTQASRFEGKLRPLAANVHRREESSDMPTGYQVLAADQGDPDANRALLSRLGEAGLKDYALIRKGPNDVRVSLGLYRLEETAQRRREKLAEKGFSSEVVVARYKTVPAHWLVVELRPTISVQSVLLRKIVDSGDSLTMEPRECAQLASNEHRIDRGTPRD